MKKNYFTLLFAAVAALVSVSCSKETPVESSEMKSVSNKIFKVEMETVKSTYDDATHKVRWAEGDAIGVASSSDDNVRCALISAEDGTFDASDVMGDAPFCAVYPYSTENTFTGNVLTASVPAVQQLVEGYPVAPGALLSAAVSDSYTLSFKNCVALIAVNIVRNDINKVEILSNAANEYIAGQFTVDMSESSPEVETVSSNASQVVTLLPANETFEAGIYYVSVLPGTISDCSIKFFTADDSKEYSVPGSVDFVRSAGVDFGKVFVRDIATKEQFKRWASKGDFTTWDVVNLVENIDMTGEAYTEVKNFVGEFNGNNHTIKGLSAAMFESLYGYVHDLVLDCDITVTAITGNDYGYGMLAHYSYLDTSRNAAAKIANVTTKGSLTVTSNVSKSHNLYVGGIVGCSNGCQLVDCVNEAAVNNASVVTSGNHSTGGIAGGYQSATGTTTLSPLNCVNKGDVISAGSSESHIFVGGCFGFINTPIELTSCTNNGSVTNDAVKGGSMETGGVVGYFWSSLTKANMKDCSNTGNVKDESTYTTKAGHYMGGVIGRAEGSAPAAATSPLVARIALDGCVNSGVVTMSPSSASAARAGGIMGTCTNYVAFTNCINNGSVNSTCAPGDLQLSGILAMIEKGATFTNCENHGDVTNTGVPTSSIRIGGFGGNSNNPPTPITGAAAPYIIIDNCRNTGAVSNNSSATVQLRSGGFLGSAACFKITSCGNTGDVVNVTTSTTMSRIMMAGFVGCSTGGTNTNSIEECTNNCSVSFSGSITTNDSAMLVGYTDANMLNLTNNKVKGSFNGTLITADNFSSYLWKTGTSTKVTSTGNTYGE